MSDLNRVILMGHLGADPELRTTADGLTLLKMRIATGEAWLDKTSRQLQERTEWHTVTLFGNRVEGLSRILHKGDCIVVEGSLRTSSWEKDGVKRYRTEVVAREICLTGKKAPRAAAAGAPVEADAVDPHDVDETLPSSTGPASNNNGSSNGRRSNGNGLAVPSQVLVADIPF
jgi:single-strand DNA-binding protein